MDEVILKSKTVEVRGRSLLSMVVDKQALKNLIEFRLFGCGLACSQQKSNDGFVRAKSRENLVSWVDYLVNPV